MLGVSSTMVVWLPQNKIQCVICPDKVRTPAWPIGFASFEGASYKIPAGRPEYTFLVVIRDIFEMQGQLQLPLCK
jgi:hypothetical protein